MVRGRESGQSVEIATIKDSVGQVLPPNQVVFESTFNGIEADLQYLYVKGGFQQNVILKERPPAPNQFGLPDATTRLEVWTEFIEPPEPQKFSKTLKREADAAKRERMVDPDLIDETLNFGASFLPVGKAFALDGEPVTNLTTSGGIRPVDLGNKDLPVGKRWLKIGERTVLIEALDWRDLEPRLGELQARAVPANAPKPAASRTLQARVTPASEKRNVQIATAVYAPKGFVIDYTIMTGAPTSFTFDHGATYYVSSFFWIGTGTTTFRPGCTIKYTNGVGLALSGPVSFPDTLQTPVLTSCQDDGFGETLPNSTGNPTYFADRAIFIYYPPGATTVKNVRIRWAKEGMQYDHSTSYSHMLNDSIFENCQVGVDVTGLSAGYVALSNIKKWNVATPILGTALFGSMSDLKFYTDQSFVGITEFDALRGPPDPNGALNSSHVVEVVNDYIRVYTRATGATEGMSMSSFLGLPTSNPPPAIDPRILFDHFSGRWVACAISRTTFDIYLRVSKSSDPSNLAISSSSGWYSPKTISAFKQNWKTDYTTLALDINGIYITAALRVDATYPYTYDGQVISTVKKPEIYSDTFIHNKLSGPYSEIETEVVQPVLNFDTPVGGYVWFVAKDRPVASINSYIPGKLRWRRAKWVGSSTVWEDNAWQTLNLTSTRFFDLDNAGKSAPQLNGSPLTTPFLGSRLMLGFIRDNHLWTCQTVGLDGTDGDYDGDYSGASVDRTGTQWWKIQIATGGSGLTYGGSSANGIVYDANNNSQAYWHLAPSLMVNTSGHMVLGFSASRATEYPAAFYVGRTSSGTFIDRISLVQGGRNRSYRTNWGDYSGTCIDPSDPTVFWTFQEFGDLVNDWGSWITSIKVAP